MCAHACLLIDEDLNVVLGSGTDLRHELGRFPARLGWRLLGAIRFATPALARAFIRRCEDHDTLLHAWRRTCLARAHRLEQRGAFGYERLDLAQWVVEGPYRYLTLDLMTWLASEASMSQPFRPHPWRDRPSLPVKTPPPRRAPALPPWPIPEPASSLTPA